MLEEASQRDKEKEEKLGVVTDKVNKVDMTPWMRRTGWIQRFSNRNMNTLSAYSQKAQDSEEQLKIIEKSCIRIINHCLQSVRDIEPRNWTLLLFYLNSTEKDKPDTKPFRTYYNDGTPLRYGAYWGRFICFLVRTMDDFGSVGVELLPGQWNLLNQLRSLVWLEDGTDNQIDEKIFDLSVSLIKHSDYSLIRSSLIHFTGILGYNEDTKTWRQPMNYTPTLAAFQFCIRVIIFEHALPTNVRDYTRSNPMDLFRKVRDVWLVDGEPGPFNYIHKLMVYGLAAAREHTGRDRVWFSPNKETCYYEGRPLIVNDWIKCVHSILDDTERIMKQLVFLSEENPLPFINLYDIIDAPNYSYNGYSLVNAVTGGLEAARRTMMERLVKSNEWNSMVRVEPDTISFNPSGVKKYMAKIIKCLELILFLVNTTCGMTGRGTEVTSLRYINVMECLRNIMNNSGQMMFVTEYHKSMAIMDEIKVIPRFLPHRVSQLLAIFITEIIPFCHHINPDFEDYGFLFTDPINGQWDTDYQTKVFVRETQCRLGFRMTTQDYRHISSAFDREFIRGKEVELLGDDDNPHDQQATHSSRIANNEYGRDKNILKGLSAHSIDIFRGISDLWQKWLNLTSRLPPPSKILSAEGSSEYGSLETRVETALKKWGGSTAVFRTKEQKHAAMSMARGINPLVVIFPTGSGKSMLFQFLSMMEGAATTVVITPLVALANEIVDSSRRAGVDCIQWTRSSRRAAALVVVAAETSMYGDFKDLLWELHHKGKLDRIILDECHFIVTAISYRQLLGDLKQHSVPVPFNFFTATLPPVLQSEFEKATLIQDAVYIRVATGRSNFVYSVTVIPNDTSLLNTIRDAIQTERPEMFSNDKVLVFCTRKAQCDSLSEMLGCLKYYSNLQDKDEQLSRWKQGSHPVMVATGALGAGINISGITTVIHVGKPNSLIDFVQESGRGGRKGEVVDSKVFIPYMDYQRESRVDSSTLTVDENALRSYLIATDCRQKVLTEYMDGREFAQSCSDLNGQKCDLCSTTEQSTVLGKRRQQEELDESQRNHKYQQRQITIENHNRDEGLHLGNVEALMNRLESECPMCWFTDGLDSADHDFNGCECFSDLMKSSYESLRDGIRYRPNTCCYTCSRPGNWCRNYSKGKSCGDNDVIMPVVLAAYRDQKGQEIIKSVAGKTFSTLISYMFWLVGKTNIWETQGTNAMKLFDAIVRIQEE